jgi:trigger factor
MATKKPPEEQFPSIGDDDDDEPKTSTRTRTSTVGRSISMMSGDAMRAMLERAPTAAPTSVTVPNLPDVEAPNLDEISVTVPAAEPITAEQIAAAFAAERREHAAVRDRPEGEAVGAGDEVMIDVIGYSNGEIIPFSVRNEMWVDAEPDDFLPGLFEGLVGIPVGESEVIDVDLPDDYVVPELRGAPASFAVSVHAARELTLPDDEDPKFLAATGLGKTLDEVMLALRAKLEEDMIDELVEEGRQLVIDQLAARVQVDLPKSLVDEEIRRRWLDAEGKTLATLGHEFDEQERALDRWKTDEITRALAERSLRVALAIGAIAKRDGVSVGKEEIDGFLSALAEGSGIDMQSMVDVVQRDKKTQRLLADKLLNLLTFEHVMAFVEVRYEGDEGEEEAA